MMLYVTGKGIDQDLRAGLPIRILLFTLLLFSHAITTQASENDIHLSGKRLEYNLTTGRLSVYEDVTMTREGFRLSADGMELDLNSGQGMATGEIHLYSPEGYRLDTGKAEFNIHTGWWRIGEADMWIEPSGLVRFNGAEQEDPTTISLINPRFTTCLGESPPWEIRGKRGILKTGRSLKITHMSLWIKGMPLFYLPSTSVPIRKTETHGIGIQPPEAGHSSRQGFFLKNHLSWPLTSSTEGLFFLDIFTRTGIGIGAGWNYRPERDSERDSEASYAKFYLLREDSPERIHGKGDLFADLGSPESTRAVVDVHYATERDYDHRFSLDQTLRDQRIGESRIFGTMRKSGLAFSGGWEHARSLLDPNKSDIHQIPRISSHLQFTPVSAHPVPFSPLAGLDISAIHSKWDLHDAQGEGESVAVEPRLGFSMPAFHWAQMNSFFSSRQTYYHTDGNVPYSPMDLEDEEIKGSSRSYTIELLLTGPHLYKDYTRMEQEMKAGPKDFRHLLYPQVTYEYETYDGNVPYSPMDLKETPEEVENIHCTIVNRIWERSGTNTMMPVPPLLDLTLTQTFHLKDHDQAVDLRIKALPHPMIYGNGRATFFTKGRKSTDLDADLGIGTSDTGKIALGWRHKTDDVSSERLNIARVYLYSPFWKGYQGNTSFIYDLKTDDLIEEVYGVLYQHACWKASLAFIRRIDEDLLRANLTIIF